MSAEQMLEKFGAFLKEEAPAIYDASNADARYIWTKAWQAALATQPQAPQGAEWLPIETAPETTESKDVLLSGKFGVHMGKVFNYGGGDIVVVITHIAGNAVEGISHFMHIPATPKTETPEGEK